MLRVRRAFIETVSLFFVAGVGWREDFQDELDFAVSQSLLSDIQ